VAPGYPLVYDQRERQYRGSLVGLTPDTLYDIRIEADGQKVELQTRTRSEEFPIGKLPTCPAGPLPSRFTFEKAAPKRHGIW
jgi:hypothetical protein